MAEKVDAVIVGFGAAGAIVAKQLAEAGLRIVVLEKGRKWTRKDVVHDELRGDGIRPDTLNKLEGLEKNPRAFRSDDWSPARIVATGFNAFGVGGGTPWYGAAAWRFHEEHFRMKSTYGRPSGTTVEDWPTTYADLEPHYEKAEYELGVSGLAGADPRHWERLFARRRKRRCRPTRRGSCSRRRRRSWGYTRSRRRSPF